MDASATAYRSGGGDGMTNVELLSILLSVAGLIVGVFALAIKNKSRLADAPAGGLLTHKQAFAVSHHL